MSLTEWKKVYYSKEPKESMTEVEAIKHSIKKWQGLSPLILKKYGLKKEGNCIYDAGSHFYIDSESCALCIKHPVFSCGRCSLKVIRDNKRCDARTSKEHISPYMEFKGNGNPKLMLKWLRKALKQYEIDHS